MDSKSIQQLKVFTQACKANPAILHDPSLAFFKEYIETLGATVIIFLIYLFSKYFILQTCCAAVVIMMII